MFASRLLPSVGHAVCPQEACPVCPAKEEALSEMPESQFLWVHQLCSSVAKRWNSWGSLKPMVPPQPRDSGWVVWSTLATGVRAPPGVLVFTHR